MMLPHRWTALRASVIAATLVAAVALPAATYASGPVQISFWNAMSAAGQLKAMNALIGEFNRTHPGVHVTNVTIPDYPTLLQKTIAAIAAGDPPTVAQAYEQWAAQYVQDHAITPLDSFIRGRHGLSASSIRDFFPALWKDGQLPDHKQWMMPFNKADIVLYYNKALFKAAHIARPPATWTQFAADARKLTHGQQWAATIVPSSTNSGGEAAWEAMLHEWGGRLTNAARTRVAFDSTAGTAPLALLRSLVKDKLIHLSTGYGDQSDFESGHAAMDVSTIAGYSYIAQGIGHKFPWGVAFLPAGPKGRATTVVGTNLVIFKLHHSTAQRNAAWTFIKWLTSTHSTEYWSVHTGYVPVRISSAHRLAGYYHTHPNHEVAVLQLHYAHFDPPLPSWTHVQTIIARAIDAALLGQTSPAAALKQAAQASQAVLSGNP